MNTTVFVRDYRDSDYSFVNQMLLDSFSVTKGEDNLIGAEYHELVGVIDSNVVGYLLLTKVYNPIIQKSYHLIDYVCVSSNYRRLGVGKALLQKAYEIARSEHSIYLQLTGAYDKSGATAMAVVLLTISMGLFILEKYCVLNK